MIYKVCCIIFFLKYREENIQIRPIQRSSSAKVHGNAEFRGKQIRTMANNSIRRQRTGFQSDSPERTNISTPDFTSRTCVFWSTYTLWSEQCTMTCRTQDSIWENHAWIVSFYPVKFPDRSCLREHKAAFSGFSEATRSALIITRHERTPQSLANLWTLNIVLS